MFHVIYDEDKETCVLQCPRCGNSHESNFSNPDPKSVLISHFNEDDNSGIPVCSNQRWTPDETPWEAASANGEVRARGRVVVKQIDNAIQSPDIVQDYPSPSGAERH